MIGTEDENGVLNSTLSGEFSFGKVFFSHSNQLQVTFQSDRIIRMKGFLATFQTGKHVCFLNDKLQKQQSLRTGAITSLELSIIIFIRFVLLWLKELLCAL